MAYESEVKRQSKKLDDSARSAQNERNRINSLVGGAHQWWKGKGGEAFTNAYNSIDNDVNRFLRRIDDVVSNMNRLPALIERAERERSEEAARKAAEKNSNQK